MKKGLSILKPEVRTRYLYNMLMEKVRYIKVPEHVKASDLKRDIKNGAVHMKELADLIDKDSDSRHIVVTAATEEQGLLAISYLAACYNDKMGYGDDCDEEIGSEKPEMMEISFSADDEEDLDEETWYETPARIPVIHSSEIISWGNFGPGSMGGFFNNYRLDAESKNQNNHPRFWQQCRSFPVCILVDPTMGGINSEDGLFEAINFFDDNERVYILLVEKRVYDDWCYGDVFTDGDDDENGVFISQEDRLRNNIVLNYAADSVKVALEKKDMKKYYREVLHSYILKQGMGVARGFSFDRIINMIIAMSSDRTNDLIEKIFRYSLKDRKLEEGYLFRNEDFAFIDQFARTAGNKKAKDGKPAMERLQTELVGMDEIKQQVKDVVNMLKFNKIRASKGLKGSQYHNVHVMLGAPGTAKTTVAKLMGEIMVEEKLLEDNRFACVNGAELKGMFVGHSAPKTKALFDNHDIIVIDEAYSLVDTKGAADFYSNESIAQLVIELENHADDRLVIFAGYGGMDVSESNNRMKLFLDSNPGIKSRINSTFCFESYTADEMVKIFQRIAKNQSYRIEAGAEKELKEYFESRRRDKNFGNGREARSLLEGSIMAMSNRLFAQKGEKKLTTADMQMICVSDIRQSIRKAKIANEAQTGRVRKQLGFS